MKFVAALALLSSAVAFTTGPNRLNSSALHGMVEMPTYCHANPNL